MEPIIYIDRLTGKEEVELVYGACALRFVYGDDWVSHLLGIPLLHTLIKNPFFSSFYGYLQKMSSSRKKIHPFIKAFQVDPTEFLDPVDSFKSFNDFFIRKLKREVRPIFGGEKAAILPADGRYRVFPHLETCEGFIVKGEKFNLVEFLEDENLAKTYSKGSMVMARLCPMDYHRFHFPCDSIPLKAKLINGWLYSVNPIALKKDIHIFSKNKRAIVELNTTHFGKVLFIEVGATNVGSIHNTYKPFSLHHKGDELGYFSFGASSLILLFEEGTIQFDNDLIRASENNKEIKGLMGQSLGVALKA
jgi:phosphatidylserine decarboxylase